MFVVDVALQADVKSGSAISRVQRAADVNGFQSADTARLLAQVARARYSTRSISETAE